MAKVILTLLLTILSIRNYCALDPVAEITDCFGPSPVTFRCDDAPSPYAFCSNFMAVTAPDTCIDIEQTPSVAFAVNMGTKRSVDCSGSGTYTYVKIIADGCSINGIGNEFVKYYDEFHTDPAFERRVVYSGVPFFEMLRNEYSVSDYYEDFEIVFPEGECEGYVNFFLLISL